MTRWAAGPPGPGQLSVGAPTVASMGNHFQTLVVTDVAPQDASALAARALDWLVGEGVVLAERTDCVLGAPLGHPPGPHWADAVGHRGQEPAGLNVRTGRTIFDGGQGEPMEAVCPHCAGSVAFLDEDWDEDEEAWEPFGEAVHAWEETGHATVECPHCGGAGDLTLWRWEDDYYAFGHLGFEFWDWPEFSAAFLDGFIRALGSPRTVLVAGKL